MIKPWLADLISYYSWVSRVEKKGLYYFIFYKVDGKEKYDKISFRANKKQIQDFLARLAEEADKNVRTIEIEQA